MMMRRRKRMTQEDDKEDEWILKSATAKVHAFSNRFRWLAGRELLSHKLYGQHGQPVNFSAVAIITSALGLQPWNFWIISYHEMPIYRMSGLDSHIAECRRSGFGMSGPLLAKGQQARGSLVKFFQPSLAQGGNSKSWNCLNQGPISLKLTWTWLHYFSIVGNPWIFWGPFGVFYILVHIGPFSFSI